MFSRIEPPKDEAFLCPVCLHTCRVGELICASCGTLLTAQGKTRKLPPGSPTNEALEARHPIQNTKQYRLYFEIDGKQVRLPINETVTLGRYGNSGSDSNPDIELGLFHAEIKGVSRLHLCVQWRNGLPYVTDLHSTNGTLLNEARLAPDTAYPLQNGDKLRLADLEITVRLE